MDIWNDIISIIISNGVFAILFVLLFCYQLKDSRGREEKYQKTIETLTGSLQILEDMRTDLDDIKSVLNQQKIVVTKCGNSNENRTGNRNGNGVGNSNSNENLNSNVNCNVNNNGKRRVLASDFAEAKRTESKSVLIKTAEMKNKVVKDNEIKQSQNKDVCLQSETTNDETQKVEEVIGR